MTEHPGHAEQKPRITHLMTPLEVVARWCRIPEYERLKSLVDHTNPHFIPMKVITPDGKVHHLLFDKKHEMMMIKFIQRREWFDGWWPHLANAIAYWKTHNGGRVYSAPLELTFNDWRILFEMATAKANGNKINIKYADGVASEVTVGRTIETIEDFILAYLSPSLPPETPKKEMNLLNSDARFMPVVVYTKTEEDKTPKFYSFVVAVLGRDYIGYIADGPLSYWDNDLTLKFTTELNRAQPPFTAPRFPSLWRRPHIINIWETNTPPKKLVKIHLNASRDNENIYDFYWAGVLRNYEDVVRFIYNIAPLLLKLSPLKPRNQS
jgi:hypothetical protein